MQGLVVEPLKKEARLPRMRVAQLRIQSPGCRKPNPDTAGTPFLWLNTHRRATRKRKLSLQPGLGCPAQAFSCESWRLRAAGTRSRSHSKALSRAERLPMLHSHRQKTLPEVCCSMPRSFHPSEPHPGGNNRNRTQRQRHRCHHRPSYRTPKAPCLCWVSTPTNDNGPSDASAGPANSSPPACPCASHLPSILPHQKCMCMWPPPASQIGSQTRGAQEPAP